jgi:hypothetical protein
LKSSRTSVWGGTLNRRLDGSRMCPLLLWVCSALVRSFARTGASVLHLVRTGNYLPLCFTLPNTPIYT